MYKVILLSCVSVLFDERRHLQNQRLINNVKKGDFQSLQTVLVLIFIGCRKVGLLQWCIIVLFSVDY